MSEIQVSQKVFKGLEAVMESGRVNMFDRKGVQFLADKMGHPATVIWIEENPEQYAEGISEGFEPLKPQSVLPEALRNSIAEWARKEYPSYLDECEDYGEATSYMADDVAGEFLETEDPKAIAEAKQIVWETVREGL